MAAFKKILILWLVVPMLAGCEKQAPEHALVAPAGNQIKIPLTKVRNGGVHFYTYKFEGKNINFFVRTDGS